MSKAGTAIGYKDYNLPLEDGTMAYHAALGPGAQLWVQALENQTLLTLLHQSAGQQQAQSTQLETGEWMLPPSLFQVANGYVLRLEAQQGQWFVLIQASSLQVLATPPSLTNAVAIALTPTTDSESEVAESTTGSSSTGATPLKPMEPMQPLPPLKMGNMSMSQNPMRMRMGEMELTMGESNAQPSTQRFCPQCGTSVNLGDRFCAQCGHRLAEISQG
ncbi:zinc ribbon domain-containing protein [Leptolyngbya sp. AN02str]|uniref:zinc ribbon domain-containing protein n=1 Tax=Leptolyngbya sp. AN02str TaxID=3423363 RepID=UPI003D31060C